MLLPSEEVERVFRKVAQVRAHLPSMQAGHPDTELDFNLLADAIADMYQLKIEINEVASKGRYVAGMVERYADGRAVILARSQQSDDMFRLVVVKELCHLMIDEQDDWSGDGLLTIREMKIEFDVAKKDGNGVADPSRTQMSEYLALIAAIALMYPCEMHAADAEKLAQDTATVAKVALDHNMPAWAVEKAHDHSDIFSLYQPIADEMANPQM